MRVLHPRCLHWPLFSHQCQELIRFFRAPVYMLIFFRIGNDRILCIFTAYKNAFNLNIQIRLSKSFFIPMLLKLEFINLSRQSVFTLISSVFVNLYKSFFLQNLHRPLFINILTASYQNGRESTINRALESSIYPG